ncbi:alpha/beta fold hydrolase [Methanoregula sp. UBA64]|jgi:pimeloyl-ACP methyl ester carboxylesterase|uniref:alpha/beta fold hydrolase n=1 Tax=Methanoregula sp. UBA64 TaxID=1915554 RepID=UPI0025D431F4|nr:alpha/beta hydrolase [Methanoregula sp. UBA64]
MATYILVHGGNMSAKTWNRLTKRHNFPEGTRLGARYWDGTVAALEEHGHRAVAPALANEHTHNLTDHIGQISETIESAGKESVILVGHSYGGMVITGVADRLPDRIRRLVYLDAALPDPGESLFDQFIQSGIDPLSVPGLEPAAAYTEKIRFDPEKIRALLKTYIRCTESEFAAVTSEAMRKIAARREGWTCRELPTSHVPMATMPGRLYRLLLAAAE